MAHDLTLPDPAALEAEPYAEAVRTLRDHLLGAVDVDRAIGLNGRAYVVAWADRRPAAGAPTFSLATGMEVIEGASGAPEILSSGEEQITLVIDGERLIFHLVEAGGPPAHRRRRNILR